jgi:pyruvate/2-oxoacid:ferredoxin oxidoreductase alpha subunit
LISSIQLNEADLESHNLQLLAKYRRIAEAEQRVDLFRCEDAELLLVACNTPARMAKGAVRALRADGIPVGLFRPQTVWPFPIRQLQPLLERVQRFVVVEAAEGQLEDELRLALSHAGAGAPEVGHVRRYGGVLPSQREIVEGVKAALAHKGVAA